MLVEPWNAILRYERGFVVGNDMYMANLYLHLHLVKNNVYSLMKFTQKPLGVGVIVAPSGRSV